eukprot:1496227-Karenia_brevis.AAC.1
MVLDNTQGLLSGVKEAICVGDWGFIRALTMSHIGVDVKSAIVRKVEDKGGTLGHEFYHTCEESGATLSNRQDTTVTWLRTVPMNAVYFSDRIIWM